jgi:RND family efflux transporter MFP subunit
VRVTNFRALPRPIAKAAMAIVIGAAISGSAACKRKDPPPPPPPEVQVAPVIVRDVPVTSEWIGSLDGYVNAEIRPEVEGYVLRQGYREGSPVQKGSVLFEIDPRQFQAALDQARSDLARNQAALARARLDVERFTPLVAQRAVSQSELDNAISTERQLRANVEAAEATVEHARLNLAWTRVVSPIDGVAGIARAQVGNLVNAQTVMTTVSQVDPMKVFFSPSEREALEWGTRGGPLDATAGAARKGMLRLILSDGSEYPYPGDPLLQDRNIDPRTGTLQVVGVFPNPKGALRPGQYARVRAETRTRHGAILVPQRAVSELQGTFQVAVVGPGDAVEIRTVQMGERIGPLWVVTSGLHAGDRIVVEGTQKVKQGIVVKPVSPPPATTPAAG